MTTLVSVIVPALNEAPNIRACLGAARRDYDATEVEIVVADGGSSDGTPGLASEEALLVTGARGRGAQMNAGARASQGDVLVFCHADSQLPLGWREAVLQALRVPGVVGGAFQSAVMPACSWFLRLYNRCRLPADWRWIYGDQAQFMPRRVFQSVGGFAEIPLMEDLEMARAMHGQGKLARVPLRVVTSSRRFQECGVIRQSLTNFVSVIRYLYLGATVQDIARTYGSSREKAMSQDAAPGVRGTK